MPRGRSFLATDEMKARALSRPVTGAIEDPQFR